MDSREEKFSLVTIRATGEKEKVRITSDLKPEIINKVINKWQSLLDMATSIIGVPSGLIMKLNEDTIEVFMKSKTNGNPYKVGEKADLIYGLYCETVIGTQKPLIVPDATIDQVWNSNNPDIDINMISYLGVPINWPDKEVFGTICVLDNKRNNYNKLFLQLMNNIKLNIESDLELLVANNELDKKSLELAQLNNLKTRFLSLISHDIRGAIFSLDEFLKFIIQEYEGYSHDRLLEVLKSLSQSSSSITSTLAELLNWSKQDLLQLEPDKKKVNLIALIKNLLKYYKQTILFKNISIETDFIPNEIFVNIDKKMVETSFRNILSNALKFTRNSGKIRVVVQQTDNKVIVKIEDNGVGMSDRTLSKLFSYNENSTRGILNEKSTGIGLLLCKDFLDKNGANIKVTSKLNKGTLFTVTFDQS